MELMEFSGYRKNPQLDMDNQEVIEAMANLQAEFPQVTFRVNKRFKKRAFGIIRDRKNNTTSVEVAYDMPVGNIASLAAHLDRLTDTHAVTDITDVESYARSGE